MRKFRIFLIAMFACAFIQSGDDADRPVTDDRQQPTEESGTGEDKPFRIAVIPKGTANPFWKTVHAGAAKAQKELGVEIFWVGPENEDDRKQQIDVVQNHISMRVDAKSVRNLDV